MARTATGKPRIALVGAAGRLGTSIKQLATKSKKEISIIAEISRADAGAFLDLIADADVILDVSSPAATVAYLKALLRRSLKIPYVIGCTGWNARQLKTVRDYAKGTPVVLAPNFSPGVNLFLQLIEQAAPRLAAWGYDVDVHETHHARKRDAPSGTAKTIVERLGNRSVRVRSTRTGNVVGTHEVRFTGAGDVITLRHEALDRAIFARGAIAAARWAAKRRGAGFFSAEQIFSMSEIIF